MRLDPPQVRDARRARPERRREASHAEAPDPLDEVRGVPGAQVVV